MEKHMSISETEDLVFCHSEFESLFLKSYFRWREEHKTQILGSYLYRCRIKMGLTQEQFCEMIPLSKNTYSGIEYNPKSKKSLYGHTMTADTERRVLSFLQTKLSENDESIDTIPICVDETDVFCDSIPICVDGTDDSIDTIPIYADENDDSTDTIPICVDKTNPVQSWIDFTPVDRDLNALYNELELIEGLPDSFRYVASILNSVYMHRRFEKDEGKKRPLFAVEELIIGDYVLYRFYPSNCLYFYGKKGESALDMIANRVISLHSNYCIETDSILGIEPISDNSVCLMLKYAKMNDIIPSHTISFFKNKDGRGHIIEKVKKQDFDGLIPFCEKYNEFYQAVSDLAIDKLLNGE